MAEQILQDMAVSNPRWTIALLRYFNPVGAHPSGLLGEDPTGIPTNLLPYIQRVATGLLPQLTIYGNDWPGSADGTACRDFIHIQDLASGHSKALQWLMACKPTEGTGSGSGGVCETFNLGTGTKHTVLEVVHAFERASGRPIPYVFGPRRVGDVEASWADPTKAQRVLGWQATHGLDDFCRDAWRWATANPKGYASAEGSGTQ
jgi:UDP-glucose 4-epimerase